MTETSWPDVAVIIAMFAFLAFMAWLWWGRE